MTDLVHVSVLAQEILDLVITEDSKTVYDGTLGLGGHAEMVLKARPGIECYIGTDLDSRHLEYAKNRLSVFSEKLRPHLSNFSEIASIIEKEKPPRPLAIVLDLGICSVHVDDPERGFSFSADGPLHMSYSQEEEYAAGKFLMESSEAELTRVFREYGEEPFAVKYARVICDIRETEELSTTKQLVEIIEKRTHVKKRKKTLMRLFQAIRMAVNEELFHLEKALEGAASIMQSGDRIGVISYHSLEDRMVKSHFKRLATPKTAATERNLNEIIEPAAFELLTKKPIVPSDQEIADNPRARSARLRILVKR